MHSQLGATYINSLNSSLPSSQGTNSRSTRAILPHNKLLSRNLALLSYRLQDRIASRFGCILLIGINFNNNTLIDFNSVVFLMFFWVIGVDGMGLVSRDAQTSFYSNIKGINGILRGISSQNFEDSFHGLKHDGGVGTLGCFRADLFIVK